MKILGIESSCDESAVAIVDDNKNILFNKVFSQDHIKYNGVFPEIAAREHLKMLPRFIEEASDYFNQIDAIAVTIGPGLIGSLIVGIMLARGLSFSIRKPLISVNHLEGHALSVRLTENVKFPFLLLLISGGHSKILLVEDVGRYKELGTTLDDAFGEAFDKVATMLGLQYPGGPEIERCAKLGNPQSYNFPQPMINEKSCNFSLSGLKTAVKHQIKKLDNLSDEVVCDICASFQKCVSEIIIIKMQRAVDLCQELKGVVVAGGVGANQYIRDELQKFSDRNKIKFYAPPQKICTDNAMMIAWVAIERLKVNLVDFNQQDFEPKTRYNLTDI